MEYVVVFKYNDDKRAAIWDWVGEALLNEEFKIEYIFKNSDQGKEMRYSFKNKEVATTFKMIWG